MAAAEAAPRSDEGRTLLDDMKLIYTDAAFQDMVFVCGEEEEEIGACRMVVACRSPVLRSMLLTSGMAESKLHRVPLPSIAPATMRVCLEFFYTDMVRESSWPVNILSAMKVVEAALFFLLKRLQNLAITYMRSFFSFVSKGEGYVQSSELIQAYNLGAQILAAQQDKVPRMRSLLDMLRSGIQLEMGRPDALQERHVYKSLSQHAIAHFSQMPSTGYQGALCGYFSFVCLVKWSAYQLVLAEPSLEDKDVEDVLSRCVPVLLDQVASASNIDSDDANASQLMRLISNPLAKCLQVASLDFANIPSDILCKVIEPLDVVPPSTLLRAYKSQALSRPELRWDQFCHGELYSVDINNPTLITCRARPYEGYRSSQGSNSQGFARCNTYLNTANMACFDWRIVMPSPCASFRAGFCACGPSIKMSECNSYLLGDMAGSWALGSDGLLRQANFQSVKSSSFYVDPFHDNQGVVVEVHVDMVNMNCSFSINGKKKGVAWEKLHTNGYPLYPAISLLTPGKALLEMTCHKWMDCSPDLAHHSDSVVLSL